MIPPGSWRTLVLWNTFIVSLGDRPDQLAIPRGSNSSPRAVVSDAEGHSDESCHSNFVVLRRE